tara:strand:- start:434 stop:619 length:186 start_codon:yes stop_codon:yes gene_type:complete
MNHHNDVFSEIDYHEGGSVGMNKWKDEIQVYGDNGLILFEAIEIPLLRYTSTGFFCDQKRI